MKYLLEICVLTILISCSIITVQSLPLTASTFRFKRSFLDRFSDRSTSTSTTTPTPLVSKNNLEIGTCKEDDKVKLKLHDLVTEHV